MLPIGVVIPTKNSAWALERHLRALRPWQDLVEEVVLVDSFSRDGTVDILRRHLAHPRMIWLEHPPGLYESWNLAIQKVGAKYVYLSTVGDTITQAGLMELLKAAEQNRADVVISKPRFVNADGSPGKEIYWPVDDMLQCLEIDGFAPVDPLEMMVFAIAHPQHGLLGSCASDLFRTDYLQKSPFPVEFGTAGDGAWAIRNAAKARWTVLRGTFSTFLKHSGSASPSEQERLAKAPGMEEVAAQVVGQMLEEGAVSRQELENCRIFELLDLASRYGAAKCRFDHRRKKKGPPWICSPRAWWWRNRRNALWKSLQRLKVQALRAARSHDPGRRRVLS